MAVLRSQGLGVACGLATALLLGIGSIVMAALPEEASPQMDDVRSFLTDPSWRHAWFYLLVAVLAVHALNTTLCTWDHLARTWRAGQRNARTWAPSVFHLAFLVALAAHGVGGLLGREAGMVRLGPDFSPLPDGREARVLGVETDHHPDGSTRQVRAAVEVRAPDGSTAEQEVSYNGPLSSGLGTDLLILVRDARMPTGARVEVGGESCEARAGGSCLAGGREVLVTRVQPSGPWGDVPVAWMRISRPDGEAEGASFFLWSGASHSLPDGTDVRLLDMTSSPALLLRARHAPGNPLALVAALLIALGTVMMGRRWA